MLVISRKAGESVFVGNAEVKIVRIAGGSVRIGIEAPKDVKIVRKELEQKAA